MKQNFKGTGYFIPTLDAKVALAPEGYTVVSQDKAVLEGYIPGTTPSSEVSVEFTNVFRCQDHSGNPHFVEPLSAYGSFKKGLDEDICELAASALYDDDYSVILTKKFIEYLIHKGYDAIEVVVRPDNPGDLSTLKENEIDSDYIVLKPSSLTV